MSKGMQRIATKVIDAEVLGILYTKIDNEFSNALPGHCLRVTDIPHLMVVDLCKMLRETHKDANIFVLKGENHEISNMDRGIYASGTKIVELRNPDKENDLRSPLLVFIPPGVQAASEDSFGFATFREIDVSDVYTETTIKLLNDVPNGLNAIVKEIFERIQQEAVTCFSNSTAIRYLLTIRAHDYDKAVIGAALYEFGLIPDFKLVEKSEEIGKRLRLNTTCVLQIQNSIKSPRVRPFDLTPQLTVEEFKVQLGTFLAQSDLHTPISWTAPLALESSNWGLSFDKWPLQEDAFQKQQICIEVTDLTIPEVPSATTDNRLESLIGQQVLVMGGLTKSSFSISFKVTPDLRQIEGLAKFKIDVVSRETGAVIVSRNKTAWNTSRNSTKISFTSLQRYDWEEGWYYIKVLPLDKNGDLFPLVDHDGNLMTWNPASGPDVVPTKINESDLFYVLPGEDIDLEASQRAVPRFDSICHALLDTRFTVAANGRDPSIIVIKPGTGAWVKKGTRASADRTVDYEAKISQIGSVRVISSLLLREIETKILNNAIQTITWNLIISLGEAGQPEAAGEDWPDLEGMEDFLNYRKIYFQALCGDHERITLACDLITIREQAIDYATSYIRVIEKALQKAESTDEDTTRDLLSALHLFIRVDSVTINIRGTSGITKTAILLSPLHPLRVLWLTGWRMLAEEWLRKIDTRIEGLKITKENLFNTLSLMNYPPFLLGENGVFYLCTDNVSPHWTLYAVSSENDPKGITGIVCRALDLPEPKASEGKPTHLQLGKKIEQYLRQHPYISELQINIFNAGRATAIADLLLYLEKQTSYSHLRYDLRFFVHNVQDLGIAEEVGNLLNPAGTVSSPEADAFCTPSESYLFPKLRYAILQSNEFELNPEKFQSHITIIFDLFPPEEIGAEELAAEIQGSPMHAIYQDFYTIYNETDDAAMWKRIARFGKPLPINDDDDVSFPLARLSFLIARTCASVATRKVESRAVPSLRLVLKGQRRELLHKIHNSADWVLSIDRYLGIEFFDHNKLGQRPDYMLDFDSSSLNWGRKLILTSRSHTEVKKLLRSTIQEEYALNLNEELLIPVLSQIRTLSGKLPLKLLLGKNQRAEVVGLALANLYLKWYGALDNQIIVPLDCHQDIFSTSSSESRSRADLALFDLSANVKFITCRLVEVKCYNGSSLSNYNELRSSIRNQISSSEKTLREHFDPRIRQMDRPDRLIKTLELTTLLEFYLDRGYRFGIISYGAYNESKFFLRKLEEGYVLDFTRSAIIFDFAIENSDEPLIEDGIEFHRIGRKAIDELFANLEPYTSDTTDGTNERNTHLKVHPTGITSLTEITKSETAAFMAVNRKREVDWEQIKESFFEHKIVTNEETSELLPDVQTEKTKTVDSAPLINRDEMICNNGVIPIMQEIETPIEMEHNSDIASTLQPILPCDTKADILIGTSGESLQFGLIGETAGRKIGLDLNQVHAISLFGVQGAGKSYTLGSIIEMVTASIPGINILPSPLCSVVFHFSPTQDYKPEFTSMISPNDAKNEVQLLLEHYNAQPCGLKDIVLLAPKDKVELRKSEYPNIEVLPLTFSASDLDIPHWMFLMGAVGSQATYIRQLKQLMKGIRNEMSLQRIQDEIDNSSMPDNLKNLAHTRLLLAGEYIDDSASLKTIAKPGRLVVVDLRDEFIEKDEALGLFVVLLQIFADAKTEGKNFNKLVVFDEAHKYVENPDLVAGLIETVREMRHKGTSILVASQDPPSVPVSLIELSSQIILHKFNSPAWLKHIQKANAALRELTPMKMASLAPGQAYVWSSKATDRAFSDGVEKVQLRPRVTKHGGATRTALE